MGQFHLDTQNRVVIDDYDVLPPFASFLPGIAGPLGIPMWAFYVNRAQAIASFGVESKDAPIMEFQPANKAYQTVSYTGFRTFIKVRDAAGEHYYEPFSVGAPSASPAPPPGEEASELCGLRRTIISANELELAETSAPCGMPTIVLYFTLPGEPFRYQRDQQLVHQIGALIGHAAVLLQRGGHDHLNSLLADFLEDLYIARGEQAAGVGSFLRVLLAVDDGRL